MGPLKCANCGKALTLKDGKESIYYYNCLYCYNCREIRSSEIDKAFHRMFHELCRYEKIAPTIEGE